MTDERLPEGVPLHLKLDTGMGRWGLGELPAPGREVVGLMTHLATADTNRSFAGDQIETFLRATLPYVGVYVRHIANSAAALTMPETRLDAARCGIALYGIDPFGAEPQRFDLRPAMRWESEVAQVRRLAPGESTGYGRGFVALEDTWIGIVPVGYADGFRRDLTGTEVLVAGARVPVVGVVSMDALAVALPEPLERGTPVTLVGDGITFEEHARVADTIGYELACGVRRLPSVRPVGWSGDRPGRSSARAPGRAPRRPRRAGRRLLAPLSGDERALDVGCGTGRSHTRSRRSSVRSSASTRTTRSSTPPARTPPTAARSCTATPKRSRSPTGTSTSSAACACCTTCTGPSWSSPSSHA